MAPNGYVDGNEERPRIQRLCELAQRKRATDSSATLSPLWGYPPPQLAYWRLIDAYDYTYVTINGAQNLTKVSPVTGNG